VAGRYSGELYARTLGVMGSRPLTSLRCSTAPAFSLAATPASGRAPCVSPYRYVYQPTLHRFSNHLLTRWAHQPSSSSSSRFCASPWCVEPDLYAHDTLTRTLSFS
jgi:hypothetical protein